MKMYRSLTELIGHTPLLALTGYCRENGLNATIAAKLEAFNPAGSVKDRTACAMLDAAEESGALRPGGTIIEPTSGNTGIGLAWIAAARGYRTLIVMPDSMSPERRALIQAYGAELVLTDGALGMKGAIARAQELHEQIAGSLIPDQFSNPANPAVHRRTTGPEIWEDTDGKVDIFVAGVGTGGTLTGVAEYLKAQNPAVRVVAVEPATSAVLEGGAPGPHGLQGIGAGFVPATLNTSAYDEVIPVTDEEAFAARRALVRLDGVLAGHLLRRGAARGDGAGASGGKRGQADRRTAAGHGRAVLAGRAVSKTKKPPDNIRRRRTKRLFLRGVHGGYDRLAIPVHQNGQAAALRQMGNNHQVIHTRFRIHEDLLPMIDSL